MSIRFGGNGKLLILSVAVVAALALPLSAAARGWNGHGNHGSYRGGYSGSYYGHGGYGHGGYGYGSYYRGGHSNAGRWIGGAIVAGAVVGLISQATRPAPVYYQSPGYYGSQVVYSQPRVVYSDYYPAPVVRRRVVETRTVYEDPYQTRYIGPDDGDD